MESQNSPYRNEFGSPAIIGILVVIVICAFLLGFLTARFTDLIRSCLRRSLSQTSSPTSSMSETSKVENDLDLEAATGENSITTPTSTPNSNPSPTLSEPVPKNKRSLSLSSRSLCRRITSLRKPSEKKKDLKEKKVEISRPSRLLPANSSHVVVRSPIWSENETSQLQMSGSTLYNDQTRTTHQLAMSDRTKASQVGIRKTGYDELGRKIKPAEADQVVGTSSTQTPRKRTIVWYDDQNLDAPSIENSIRSLRSNSLPSPSNHSSWDATSRDETHRTDWGDAAVNLGSTSQLWLSYQFQLSGA